MNWFFMVWTYEEFYPGCPYLSDWVGKEFKFGIEVKENPVGETVEDGKIMGHPAKVITTIFDGIPKPSFYFVGDKADRPYQLSLSLRGGLTRRVNTSIEEGKMVGYRVLDIRLRNLGIGNFEDFKAIGTYALERLPKIAKEVVLPPTNFPDEIPEDKIEDTLRHRERCLEIADWEGTQRQIAREFASLFTVFNYATIGKPGIGLIPRKGDDKFTPEELKELADLINPLRNI
jgi:hypothetical protein